MSLLVIEGTVWKYTGKSSWYFVTIQPSAQAILRTRRTRSAAWGMIRVEARIGSTTWKTSIFPDKRHGYLIAIKAAVRKRENISAGSQVKIAIQFLKKKSQCFTTEGSFATPR